MRRQSDSKYREYRREVDMVVLAGMRRVQIVALVLIVAGVLGLVYDHFTYTKESHDLTIGSLELSVKDRETVNIPLWCSVGAIAVGALLLLARRQPA